MIDFSELPGNDMSVVIYSVNREYNVRCSCSVMCKVIRELRSNMT